MSGLRKRLGFYISSIVLFITLVISPVYAQRCNYFSSPDAYDVRYDTTPTILAIQTLENVYYDLCPAGTCGQVFFIENDTPNYSNATFFPTNQIRYSPNLMNDIQNNYGYEAAFAILAHEFGHFLDMQIPQPSDFSMQGNWGRELRADAWSGCALAKAGYSIGPVINFMTNNAIQANFTHPDASRRIPAIQAGYYGCGGT